MQNPLPRRFLARKCVSAFLAAVYAFTNVFAVHAAEKSFWQDRQAARGRKAPTLLAQAVPPTLPVELGAGATPVPAPAELARLPLSFD
ncbi:MAG TPA: hypothetical protein PKD69_08505, partial [Elusimicrobiota bacterium]|nr:hypothetical protein [Elusimicrobiota bacterium]